MAVEYKMSSANNNVSVICGYCTCSWVMEQDVCCWFLLVDTKVQTEYTSTAPWTSTLGHGVLCFVVAGRGGGRGTWEPQQQQCGRQVSYFVRLPSCVMPMYNFLVT